MKHTPGPWITEQQHDIIWIGTPENNYTKIDEIVVHMNYDNEYKDSVKEKVTANAKLIAAAPDLLEACMRVIEVIKENTSLYNEINSAIQKATA